jgi:hypothetical protein
MYELKRLARAAVPEALKKAERYRLLNEPYETESICLDILEVEPYNQEALIMLLLAHTDKFKVQIMPAFGKAKALLERIENNHCKRYYRGIIFERRAKAHLDQGGPGSGEMAYDWYLKAMAEYDRVSGECFPGDQKAALRWNTCARILNEHPNIKPLDEPQHVEVTDAYE